MIDLPLEHIIGERDPKTGEVVRDVRVCAMTGSRDVGVTQGIPGTPYFYRLTGGAARRMTEADRDAIKTAALSLRDAPEVQSLRDAQTQPLVPKTAPKRAPAKGQREVDDKPERDGQ